MRRHETETVECRDCGAPFNLAAQYYYDNLCPSCKREADGEEATWKSCTRCGKKVDPDNIEYVKISNRDVPGGAERVPMHEECGDEHRDNQDPEPLD